MANFAGFESLEKMKKYPYFNLNTEKFSAVKGAKYYGGVPVMYDSETKHIHIDSADTHTLVYGATGSLKTRDIVSPTVKILGYAGESMIINDPKGELFARHAGELKLKGYDIVEVNFRNPSAGNAWNPLYIPYQFYLDGDIDKASEFINDIATNLMSGDVSSKEPFWDYSASDLFYGLVQLLFKYCKEHEVPASAVNIGNVVALRRAIYSGFSSPKNSMMWKYASEDELIASSLSGSVFAPNDTMNSILSVFDQKMRSFIIQPNLMDMLANNDFDIADIGNKKTAVFLITPDEKTSYHRLVSLFIKESYEYLIYVASGTEQNKVNNRINYIVDEFSSLPKIADMPAMISAARSRDIKFLLVVQSRASLSQRYGEEADTIISNCTNWIFFTSRELDLLREISELCGCQRNGTPNISVYELQHFSKERREALVMAGRLKPAKVSMLDIDMFGKKVVPFERSVHERKQRDKLTFDFKDEVKERLLAPIRKKIAEEKKAAAEKDIGESTQRNKLTTINIDRMIDRIDKRIEKLEKQETEEKKVSGKSSHTKDEKKGD